MAEYIEREATCGDCIHACLCEHDASIPLFNRENKAYCGNFFPADVEPVRHGKPKEHTEVFCNYDGIPVVEYVIGKECPFCGSEKIRQFCADCGARMDLEVSEC